MEAREQGIELISLIDQSKEAVEVPSEAAQVSHTFYRKADPSAVPPVERSEGLVNATPTKPKVSSPLVPITPTARTNSSGPVLSNDVLATPKAASTSASTATSTLFGSGGMVTINIPSVLDSERRPVEILADEIKKHGIPDEEKFELLTKIRAAAALGKGAAKQKERENIVVIRLLAIAIFGSFIFCVRFSSLVRTNPTLVSRL